MQKQEKRVTKKRERSSSEHDEEETKHLSAVELPESLKRAVEVVVEEEDWRDAEASLTRYRKFIKDNYIDNLEKRAADMFPIIKMGDSTWTLPIGCSGHGLIVVYAPGFKEWREQEKQHPPWTGTPINPRVSLFKMGEPFLRDSFTVVRFPQTLMHLTRLFSETKRTTDITKPDKIDNIEENFFSSLINCYNDLGTILNNTEFCHNDIKGNNIVVMGGNFAFIDPRGSFADDDELRQKDSVEETVATITTKDASVFPQIPKLEMLGTLLFTGQDKLQKWTMWIQKANPRNPRQKLFKALQRGFFADRMALLFTLCCEATLFFTYASADKFFQDLSVISGEKIMEEMINHWNILGTHYMNRMEHCGQIRSLVDLINCCRLFIPFSPIKSSFTEYQRRAGELFSLLKDIFNTSKTFQWITKYQQIREAVIRTEQGTAFVTAIKEAYDEGLTSDISFHMIVNAKATSWRNTTKIITDRLSFGNCLTTTIAEELFNDSKLKALYQSIEARYEASLPKTSHFHQWVPKFCTNLVFSAAKSLIHGTHYEQCTKAVYTKEEIDTLCKARSPVTKLLGMIIVNHGTLKGLPYILPTFEKSEMNKIYWESRIATVEKHVFLAHTPGKEWQRGDNYGQQASANRVLQCIQDSEDLKMLGYDRMLSHIVLERTPSAYNFLINFLESGKPLHEQPNALCEGTLFSVALAMKEARLSEKE
jgi:hypothetical protein